MSANIHPAITRLIQCIDLEEAEQVRRYQLDQQHSLKALKAEGLALHPLIITRKNFGYADYPDISFRLPFPVETHLFKDGAAIECFCVGMEPIKGILLGLDGKAGEFRLFAPDFPDWIEEDGVGIKLAPDQRTTSLMKQALRQLPEKKGLYQLFERIHPQSNGHEVPLANGPLPTHFFNLGLNESQRQAVAQIIHQTDCCIVHGPPGTGKTTTLIEAIRQLVQQGEKILVSAPSNTAVDHIAKGLIGVGLPVLRVGNSSKVDSAVFPYTPEGKLSTGKHQKEVKELRIRAEEFRKMALKYKRSFGKEEREQRNLLMKEVKSIRNEIKQLQAYNEAKLITDAAVVLGTPVGLYDAALQHYNFHTLVIDEAGQCIEPLAWCILHLAQKWVLAGDHLQLPPTVLSNEAAQLGFNQSILETAIRHLPNSCLLNIQYRMRASIAGFSSGYFYDNLLLTADHLQNTGLHITFIDTAGSGFEEKPGSDGMSLHNQGELTILQQLIQQTALDLNNTALITPYAGQVALAKTIFPAALRISTIDSFQGQEQECILLSLVRSNEDGVIGFLKDYRRMNVALTRAKEQLFVIGDSATIGADPFYSAFLTYVESNGQYRSVWEFEW